MQALRLHRYNERPTVDELEEPKVEGPLDVNVEGRRIRRLERDREAGLRSPMVKIRRSGAGRGPVT